MSTSSPHVVHATALLTEPSSDANISEELIRLRSVIRDLGAVVVAFSGGTDSALVAEIAHQELGPEKAHIVTAISPSLARSEHEDARAFAMERGWNWVGVPTDEMENAAYRRNDALRCFHCKDALMDALDPIAQSVQATVVLGVNTDDLGEHRPGQEAAAKRGARFPMVEAELSKEDVRAIARRLGLRIWDKPAAACLASRLPYGTAVTVERLNAVQRAEAALHRLGFAELRVRHEGVLARIEVPLDAFDALIAQRERVIGVVKAAGYQVVTLDLEGFRSGSLNDRLDDRAKHDEITPGE